MSRPMMVIRWTGYVAGFLSWLVYAFLAFFSKPGSRILVPIAFAVLLILVFPTLDNAVLTAWGDESHIVAFLLSLFMFVLFCYLYKYFSRSIALTLSVFPPLRKPLTPLAPLTQAPRLDIPVPVRIAVPKLPDGSS
jgi:hypothetical protein